MTEFAPQYVKTRVKIGPLADARPCSVCAEWFAPHRKNPAARFCSRECQWVGIGAEKWTKTMGRDSAEKRGNTQRGRGAGKSYPKMRGRHAHRVIAEQKIGRPLRRGEIVHHMDENKLNYAAVNLDVLPSQADHARLHFSRKQSPAHIRKRVESRRATLAARKSHE